MNLQNEYQVFFRVEKEGKPSRIEDVIVSFENEEFDQSASQKMRNSFIMTEGIKQLLMMKNVEIDDSITFLKMSPYDWRINYLY